jgi:RNA polymerase-binding transcription factor DksA
MTSLKQRKAQLEGRLQELESRLHTIDEELEEHNNPDVEDHATEVETDEVLERMGIAGQTEMRMIQAALDRIAAGSYGICARCGEDISEERLDVLPYTPICKDCASAVEGMK